MIDLALFGCGYWGPNLLRNFNSLSNCTVKAVVDLDTRRLDHMQSLYPHVATSSDWKKMAASPDIQAVAIATPVRMHFEMARECLAAGKHVLVEKPMAASAEQCRELMALAEKGNLTLMVGHTFVYSSPVRMIKEIVDNGELGDVMYIASRRLNLGLFQKDINVAWDLLPHDLSIINFVMGRRPLTVNCQGYAHISPCIEDVTNTCISFEGNLFATLMSSWLDPNKSREMTFVGTKKMLLYDDMQPQEKIKIYDKRVEIPPYYDTYAEFHYAYHYGGSHSPFIKQMEPLNQECRHFLDCIENGVRCESGGPEGLAVVEMLEAASASLSRGGTLVEIA